MIQDEVLFTLQLATVVVDRRFDCRAVQGVLPRVLPTVFGAIPWWCDAACRFFSQRASK